jgi:SAM-dependent methyltransferase/GT2 family glycosyltransferase
LVWSRSGDRGIVAAYNEMLVAARDAPGCKALVLLHDDVEIVDDNFRPKLLRALADGVGVVGVVGASGLTGLAWWERPRRAGLLYETQGVIDYGTRRADVDAVDGLLMALAPSTFQTMLFDGDSYPAFHGYDIDYCIQARNAGLRVVVADIEVLHRTKGGYGDRTAYDAAEAALIKKWPNWITPSRVPPPVASVAARVRRLPRRLRRAPRRVLAKSQTLIARRPTSFRGAHSRAKPPGASNGPRAQGTSTPHEPAAACATACPACGAPLAMPTVGISPATIVDCPDCGTGVTWPPPSRDVEGAEIFEETYGGSRLARRPTWINEARSRVGWLELYVPDGSILELGCATGEFLSVAGDAGYEVYGVETSAWAAAEARNIGGDVVTGYLEDWRRQYPDFRVDSVVMWHVLEHVPAPLPLLREIADVLKPEGSVIIEVPNFASSRARANGASWEHASLNEHTYHYTPDGLVILLQSAGFDPREVLQFSTRVYGTTEGWKKQRNEALLERAPWPPLDMLRVLARKGPK